MTILITVLEQIFLILRNKGMKLWIGEFGGKEVKRSKDRRARNGCYQ